MAARCRCRETGLVPRLLPWSRELRLVVSRLSKGSPGLSATGITANDTVSNGRGVAVGGLGSFVEGDGPVSGENVRPHY
jgi:hypothetical protein